MEVENKPEVNQTAPDAAAEAKKLELELAQAQCRRAEAEQRSREAELRHDEIIRETSAIKFNQQFQHAIDASDFEFAPTPDQLRVIGEHAAGVKFDLSADGQLTANQNGKSLTVPEAFDQIVLKASYVARFDCAGQQRLRMSVGKGVRSRADLKTAEQRREFIKLHGLSEFEKLPTRYVDPKDIGAMSADEYRRLTPTQKAAIATEIGPDGISQILKRR